MTSEWCYEFCVYHITQEQADKLFSKITDLVEEIDAYMGGGFHEYDEAAETAEDES